MMNYEEEVDIQYSSLDFYIIRQSKAVSLFDVGR